MLASVLDRHAAECVQQHQFSRFGIGLSKPRQRLVQAQAFVRFLLRGSA